MGRSLILARNQLRAEEVGDHDERAAGRASPRVEQLARLGYVAKGALYAVIGFLALRKALAIGVAGVFLLLAAYQSDPNEARGLGVALETVQPRPLGPYVLGAVALGLLVYGAFIFAIACDSRIDPA